MKIYKISALNHLLKYSDRYQISIQFWPDYNTVYIMKDDVDLNSWGGDGDFAIIEAGKYLDRLNKIKP